MAEVRRAGFIGIIGRPNVGKSTLLNRILGQKISITTAKPQTTRHRILGIKTAGDTQAVYVDTPGLHRDSRRAINRLMNRAALDAIEDVDVVVLVVEGLQWTHEDQWVLGSLANFSGPVILAVNKVDRLVDKSVLLPRLEFLAAKRDFADVIPVSARTGDNIETLQASAGSRLPEGEFFFEAEQITDRSERFLASELIREKLMRSLGQELPYALTVEIERFEATAGLVSIAAVIWVERSGQKGIVIGKGGSRLKETGQMARRELERLFGNKVFLQLWVKVREGWSDDERSLLGFGYRDT